MKLKSIKYLTLLLNFYSMLILKIILTLKGHKKNMR
jgi:hypothetical protein